MLSKTPNFDKTLNEILENLKPHQKTCRQCGRVFEIFKEDIEFYKKLRVPPPTLCLNCRMQRRFGFYNNILKFYKKEDARTGEKTISTFHPESPYKIYDLKYWWSDKWTGEDYGRDYDFNKPFFEQFRALNLAVPHPAITHYWRGVIDSPYTISIIEAKRCYLSALSADMENVHYSYYSGDSRDCFDCLHIGICENSYELIYSNRCYNCKFCYNCKDCIDSAFLYECRNCSNCFACANLRHKSYCFFNKQLTKEEYNKKIQEIHFGNREILNEYKRRFEDFIKKFIKKNLHNDPKNINCIGDLLDDARNCYQVVRGGWWIGDVGIENLRYCVDIYKTKDSMDLWVVGPNVTLTYELVETYNCFNVKFSFFIRDGLELEYCLECHNCQYCFGCIGLRNKKYCIFNKPYSEENYWKELDKIKTKMLKDEEYGEFFPLSMSLHSYNDTYAQIEFPLTKGEVLKNGWQWSDEPKIPPDLMGLELIEAKDVPKDIKDVDDSILNKAIVCEITGKPFRIIKPELEFYQKHNLPVPTKHPYQRMLERFQKRNPSKLWESICAKCQSPMYTSYPPEKQKELRIYCEKCYLQEVV